MEEATRPEEETITDPPLRETTTLREDPTDTMIEVPPKEEVTRSPCEVEMTEELEEMIDEEMMVEEEEEMTGGVTMTGLPEDPKAARGGTMIDPVEVTNQDDINSVVATVSLSNLYSSRHLSHFSTLP